MYAFLFFSMIFCHIIDDYVLQGVLAKLKQKEWWLTQDHYSDFYKYDYIIGLIMHSFEWTFMIMLPLAIYSGFCLSTIMIFAYIINTIVHAIVDDLKANRLRINLIHDQLLHIIQIIITFLIYRGGL